MKYEYCFWNEPEPFLGPNSRDVPSFLNQLGAKGWELVTALQLGSEWKAETEEQQRLAYVRYVFKRPIP